MHGVRAFGAGIGEWREQFLFGLFDLCIVEGWSGDALGMVSGGVSGAAAEDKQIGERVAAKAIRPVQTGGGFAGGKKTRNGGLGGFGIHANAAHHVVAGGADFHRAFGDVHVGQFLELVIHAGELLLHVFSGLVRDIEISAAVFGAAAFLDFRVDGARNDVARREFHALGVVSFHEALAHFIAQ